VGRKDLYVMLETVKGGKKKVDMMEPNTMQSFNLDTMQSFHFSQTIPRGLFFRILELGRAFLYLNTIKLCWIDMRLHSSLPILYFYDFFLWTLQIDFQVEQLNCCITTFHHKKKLEFL
jgi:hypothetical protein